MKTIPMGRSRGFSQSGMSLMEALIALTILLIVSVGIMAMAGLAMKTTENQGHLEARAAEYAQDKMEQLLSLSYGDGDSPTAGVGTDTTVFPACSPLSITPPACSTGTGLRVGGSSDPTAPVNKYVDYLDRNGNSLGGGATAPANWFYIRVWKIDVPTGTTNLKRITVTAKVAASIGPSGAAPQATVASLKASPF